MYVGATVCVPFSGAAFDNNLHTHQCCMCFTTSGVGKPLIIYTHIHTYVLHRVCL